MNTSGGAGNVRGILSELQTNVARKKNDIAALDNKIQERQISLNQLIQPKLQKLAEEKEEKERENTELESLLVSKEKCRLELMNEHASALHSLKSMKESLEEMEEKIQDKIVEDSENSRFWLEKSRKDAELMMKLKMSGGGNNQDLIEKAHSSFKEKERILEDLKLRLQKSQDLAASIDAKNQEIKLAMADKPLNEIEQSLAREQMRSMDLDKKEKRLAKSKKKIENQRKFKCELCDIEIVGEKQYNIHLASKKHQKTHKKFKCESCNVEIIGEEQYNRHIKGKTHKKKCVSVNV